MLASPRAWYYFTMALLLLGLGASSAVNDSQPYLNAAQQALETSRIQLGKVTPDKGGHRSRAIGYINMAIEEVKIARVENKNVYTASESRR